MQLIVNADDFGLCESVNEAIIESFLKGNLTSTTLMVNMPGSNSAAQLSKKHSKLGVGLHLSLTEGNPLSTCPSLTNKKGQFVDRSSLLQKVYLNQISEVEIVNELEAQLEKALSLGVNITHMDSHQHVHLIPKIFKIIYPVLESKSISLRAGRTFVNYELIKKNPLKFIKQFTLRCSLTGSSKIKIKSPGSMLSIHDFPFNENEKMDYSKILELITKTFKSETIELIVHPYKDSNDLRTVYPDDYQHRLPFFRKCFYEYDQLTMKDKLFNSENIELINYSHLK